MNAEIGQTARLVEGLASQAQDIGKVLDVIRAIAEQTNSPSMPPSRPPAPASRAADSRWSPTRCAPSPTAPSNRPMRSKA